MIRTLTFMNRTLIRMIRTLTFMNRTLIFMTRTLTSMICTLTFMIITLILAGAEALHHAPKLRPAVAHRLANAAAHIARRLDRFRAGLLTLVQKLLFSSATGRRVQPSRPPRRRILRGFAACCLPALQRALRAIRSVALHNARCCSQRAALIIASHLMRHAELDGESVSAVLNWVLGTPSTHSFGCLVLLRHST